MVKVDQSGRWSHEPAELQFAADTGTLELTVYHQRFEEKWRAFNHKELFSLLISFGYLLKEGERGEKRADQGLRPRRIDESTPAPFEVEYALAPKAFDLLRTPVTPPTIFISYRRKVSSVLSLLIEARLKLADRNINVFIDKLLEPGDEWHAELEARVRQSRYFVCLLAPKSLESKFVRNEITWALNEKQKRSDFLIIPICHDEFHFGAELHDDLQPHRDEIMPLLDQLGENNAILVKKESAEEYELALIKLLNRLGYSTI